MPTADGLRAAGEVPSAPSTPAERLSLRCRRSPSRGPEMLRTLAAKGLSLRAISTTIKGEGTNLSHVGVKSVISAAVGATAA
jgi:hypothetical protein